jgi:hypothetical protein
MITIAEHGVGTYRFWLSAVESFTDGDVRGVWFTSCWVT